MMDKKIKYRNFTNPVAKYGADPWVVRDGDDFYYCYSTGNGVAVNRLEGIDKITSEGGSTVYTAPEGTSYSREYWAPELHKLRGKWYIYVAADNGDNYNHRMYVLRAKTDSPLGEFEMIGKITDDTDKWAIDGTVLEYKNELYFIWSGWEGDENICQNLYIAHMSDPMHIAGERALLSTPEFDFELHSEGGPLINEGPVALTDGEIVTVVYSASGSWTDHYCLCELVFNGGDICDSSNWHKTEKPILSAVPNSYGPGHCSFARAVDGKLFVIYHANLKSGTSWGGRSVRVQPVEYIGGHVKPDGGKPAEPGDSISIAFSE